MAGNGSLVRFNPKAFEEAVRRDRKHLEAAAASHVDLRRLYRIVLTAATQTPQLRNCTTESLVRSMMMAAALGVEPGSALGEAYLVPFGEECQLIIGYRGLITLARRSGEVESIQADVVYEGDEFQVEKGLNPILRHVPGFAEPNPNKILFAYAVARLKGGAYQFDVMTRAEIEAVRARSKAGRVGPWVTDFAEMSKKTVVRRMSKYLPMSIEMARALDQDNSIEFGDFGAAVDVPAESPSTDPLETDITEAEETDGASQQQTLAALRR